MSAKELKRLQQMYALPSMRPAPVNLSDVPGPRPGMTEQQILDRRGFGNQRLSENVEVRPSPYGMTVNDRVKGNQETREMYDRIAALLPGNIPGMPPVNQAALTSDPYETWDPRAPRPQSGGQTYPEFTEALYPPGFVQQRSPFDPAKINLGLIDMYRSRR